MSALTILLLWCTQNSPFLPQPILPGGKVIPLYAPDSPHLRRERLAEVERYNTALKTPSDRTMTVLNIHNPTVEVHLVGDDPANTGTAVIVAPGGGHQVLWIGPEGADCVPFFRKLGVSTLILRNRLRIDGYEPTTDAVRDAQQALQLARTHAAEWKLDPARIGIMGFSAGAELAAPAALQYEDFDRQAAELPGQAAASARPDFVALIYPGPTPFTRDPATRIPANVPPTFIASAGSGDRVHALWANDYFTPMLKAGVPNIEMHLYGRGGHGGALAPRGGMPFGTWSDRYVEWLRDLGFLQPAGMPTRAAIDVEAHARKQP